MSRTNIEIDDDLMAAAMKASGQATKKGAVEQAMRQLVRNQELRQAIERLRGIGWDAPPTQERHFREDGTVYYDDDEK